MTKKITAVLLAGVLTASMIGCGRSSESTEKTDSAVSETVEESSETDEKETVEESKVEVGAFDKSATIEETVLIDQDDIKVTATELTFTNYSAEVAISIENNSDKSLSFIASSLRYACNSVNGYMVSDGYLNEDVDAGKKTNEKISFSLDELQAYGINSIADIEIGIYTTDEDYNSIFYEPKKILTSVADSYDYKTDSYKKSVEDGVLETMTDCKIDYWNTDQIYNQESVSIESVALITNRDGEQSFFIELSNASDKVVNAAISSVGINDLILYGGSWSANSINPGAKGISDIKVNNLLDKEYQELIQVGDISSLSFNLVLQNSDYEDINSAQMITVKVTDNPSSYKVTGRPIVDSNGIKLTEIGIVTDEDSYSSYAYHIFYAVENGTSDMVNVDCDYDSLSINGYMMDFYDYNGGTPAGMTGLLRIDLDKDDIESSGITTAEDIKEIEFLLKVKDDHYNKVLEEKVVTQK